MTSGTVGGAAAVTYAACMDDVHRKQHAPAQPVEQDPSSRGFGLLPASGVAAIAVVAWVAWQDSHSWPLLAVHLIYAALFVAAALDRIQRPGLRSGWLAVCLMLLVSLVAVVLFPYQISLILAVVLAASAPYHLSARQSWAMLVAANTAFILILNHYHGLEGQVPGLLSLFALQAFAISSSEARQREEQARLALAARNEELQAARAELARQSQAEERLRIAGALHDTLGHRLTALQLQLEVLTQEAPPALRGQVTTCKQLSRDLLEEVRAIVRRMPGDEPADLPAALDDLARSTPGVELRVAGALPQVTPALAQQLAFCFQEAVHNAVRHGGADVIEIGCSADGFYVEDNGCGLNGAAPPSGFGLRNMDQRLAPFGGRVWLEARTGGEGCRLRLELEVDRA